MFTKGKSGNPGGKKPGTKNVRTVEIEAACKELAAGCFSELKEAIHDPDRQSWAIPLVLGYGYGKPRQQQDVNISGSLGLADLLQHIEEESG